MTNLRQVRERQAEWQKSRRHSSWPEKVHQAEAVRDSVRQLREMAGKTGQSSHHGDNKSKP